MIDRIRCHGDKSKGTMCARSKFLSAWLTQSGFMITTIGSAQINGKRHLTMAEMHGFYHGDIVTICHMDRHGPGLTKDCQVSFRVRS